MDRIAGIIKSYMALDNKNNKWLAQKLNIRESTLSSKFKGNTFTAEELIAASALLGIDLNKIIKERMKDMFKFGEQEFEIVKLGDMTSSEFTSTKMGHKIKAMFYMEDEETDEISERIYVLYGEKVDDNWQLMTLTNYGQNKEYRILKINGYRLMQMKGLLGLKLETMDKTLEDVLGEIWSEIDNRDDIWNKYRKIWLKYLQSPSEL